MAEANRRRHPRVKATKVVAHLSGEGETLTCTVENISAGGLFVRSVRRFDVGTMVKLTLARPGLRKAPVLSARVTSALEVPGLMGMGLQFDPPEAEDLGRLRNLLEELGVPVVEAARAAPVRPPQPVSAPARRGTPPFGTPAPVAAPPRPVAQSMPNETQRLMMQIQGLLQELGEAQSALAESKQENARLKAQLSDLKVLLGHRS